MNDNEEGIAWTDVSWTPVHGCSKVSAGCENCYAERLSYHRFGHTDKPWDPEHATENVRLQEHTLDEPYALDEPSRVFVSSMGDLFHSAVPDDYIEEIIAVMRNCPEHIFQVLTKRPGRAAHFDVQWPPNVWVGTSVEDERVTERLDLLRPCDADTLFVSFEPLLGAVGDVDLEGYEWIIVGGESGPEHREMSHEWVWPIKDEARRVDAAFFFKQSAARLPEQSPYLRCRDGVRRSFRELPEPAPAVLRARAAREVMA